VKANIYFDNAMICFTIENTKERYSFKHHTLTIRVHPQHSYDYLNLDRILEWKDKILEKMILEKEASRKEDPSQEECLHL